MSAFKSIDFYFDFSSPYAFFSIDKIERLANEYNRTLNWKPILLGVIIKETGNLVLREQPLKSEYAMNDWNRISRFDNIDWSFPSKFPVSSVNAARLFYLISEREKNTGVKFAKEVFKAYFVQNIDISCLDELIRIAEYCEIDRGNLESSLNEKSVKLKLREETANAIESGVVGSPFFVIDGEPFWGSDRMWMIKRWLKSGGW